MGVRGSLALKKGALISLDRDTAEIEEFLSGVFPSVRSAAMINV